MTHRSRTAALLLAGAASFALITPLPANAAPTAPTPAVPAPTAAAQPSLKPADAGQLAELETAVADLNARAAEISERLAEATRTYEAGQENLQQKRDEARAARERASAAEDLAEVAQDQIAAFARMTYMGSIPQDSTIMYLLTSANPDEVLHHAGIMERLGEDSGAEVATALKALETAKAERRKANRTQREAENLAKQLNGQLETIRTEALVASEELSVKVAELDVVRLQAQASAGVVGGEMCSAPMPSTYPTLRQWGGYSNGLIPGSALCPISPGHALRWDAAAAFRAMDAAYMAHFGTPLCITDTYRDYAGQVDVFARKPGLAAQPGTSNHGWALAVDFCGGIETFGTIQHQWMQQNANLYGWFHPEWARAGGGREEAWHWEYGQIS